MHRHSRLLALVVVALLALAIGGRAAIAQPVQAKWTLLIYQAADNNIEGDLLSSLEQMAEADAAPGVNVVVQIARDPESDNTDSIFNLAPFTTTKRLLVQHHGYRELQDLGNLDSGDPGTLADFINWGTANYPAQHYLLDLNDHGGDWQGCCQDDQFNSFMALPSIASALQRGGTKFDVLGFDACMMATLEVATQLQPYAGLLLGSEEETPYNDWDYTAVLTALAGNPSMSAADLATEIADSYVAGVQAGDQPENAAYATQSVTDLSQIGAVDTAFTGFVAAVNGWVNDGTANNLGARLTRYGQIFAQAGVETPAFGAEGPRVPGETVDLGLLAANTANFSGASAVQQAASALQRALASAVVHAVAGRGYGGTVLSGLTIAALPHGEGHADDMDKYGKLGDPVSAAWSNLARGFDAAIAAAGSDSTPTVPTPSVSAATISPGQQATISGQVSDSALVTDVEVSISTRLNGRDVYISADQREDHLSQAVSYTYVFDGMGWFISDGNVDEPIYSESWRPGQRIVYGQYRQNPRRDLIDAYFIVDESSGRLLQGFDVSQVRAVGALLPGSRSTFAPYVLDVANDSPPIPLEPVLIKQASLSRRPLPAGRYGVDVYGENVSGNSEDGLAGITVSANGGNAGLLGALQVNSSP